MEHRLFFIGFLVFLAGFGLMLAGTIGQGSVSAGGVIFVGPVPIAFGAGPNGLALALGSVLIGAIVLALVLIWSLRSPGMKED